MSYSNYSSLRPGAALAPLRPGAVALAPPKPISAAASSAADSLRGIVARLGGRLAAWLRAYAQACAEQRRARKSERQLMALGKRELKDMGISRSEILSVVYGPATRGR